MASLEVTARIGTAEEFRELFSPEQANFVSHGHPLLAMALGNTTPEARYEIANLLLDCGAQADFHSGSDGEPALRILLGANLHDPEETTRLAIRLIDAGADVNARSKRGDGLLDVVKILPRPESDWEALYDMLFSQGISGFETPNRAGVSPLEGVRKRQPEKADLLRRIEEALERQAK